MLHIEITLKSGKEIAFNYKCDEILHVMSFFTKHGYVEVEDGRNICIDPDEIALVQSWKISAN